MKIFKRLKRKVQRETRGTKCVINNNYKQFLKIFKNI